MLPFPIIKPTQVIGSPFSTIKNGESHLLLLKNNGNLYGSGSNANSQLNQSSGSGTGSYSTFVLVDTNVQNVWAGDNCTIWASNDGNLYFCGLFTNASSTLITSGLKKVLPLPAGISVNDISTIRVVYDSGFCLITKSGRAFCHGVNTSNTFRPYVDSSTGTLPSFTYFDNTGISTAWVECIINSGSVLIKDFQLNTCFASSSATTRHSGTFVSTTGVMYRYLNAGWNNFTVTSAYYPNYSFYACDSTSFLGFNYSSNSLRRGSDTVYTGASTVYNSNTYYVLNSYSSLTSTAYSQVQADINNLSSLQCLRASNGSITSMQLGSSIIKISGRTNMYSILCLSNAYVLTKTGTLTPVNYSSIVP